MLPHKEVGPVMGMITALCMMVLLGLGAGTINKQNGRSFVGGFLAGLLLGPIGLLIVFLIRPKRSPVTAPPISDEETEDIELSVDDEGIRCPNCNALNPIDADACWICEHPLPKPDTAGVMDSYDDETPYLSNEEYDHLTPRQRAAVDDYSYLLTPEDADTLAAMRARFQYTEIILFLRDHGTKVTRY